LVIRQSPDDQGRIASLGEDSRICLWNLVSGELLTQIEAHQGSSVWAADWIPSLNTLVSGGGDGSIRLWSASSHFMEPVSKHLDLTSVTESASDVPRLAATIAETHWIVTHHGGIYCWQNQNWVKVYQNSQLRNGCVMDTDPSTSSMILGTLCGSVFVFTCCKCSPS
jgi:WD40 repeat protein